MKLFRKIACFLAIASCVLSVGCVDLFGGHKTCKDEDNDHLCDTCHKQTTACKDMDANHLCDICNVATSSCLDTDNDHLCDVCDGRISDCKDENHDHLCETCGQSLSHCKDDNHDHLCDICGESVSVCQDEDEDGKCDVCGKTLQNTPTMYVVKYYVDGELVRTANVNAGSNAPMQVQPDKPYYEEMGWTTDVAHTNVYDFERKVESNLILHAYYKVDYAEFTSELTKSYMDGIVSVHTRYYDETYTLCGATGSGVIYALEDGAYYLLTNNHVVYQYKQALTAGRGCEIIIRDCFETEYYGALVCNDAEYDLSVIRFNKSAKRDLGIFAFADSDPVKGQEVVAIGSPLGQKNAITYGTLLAYAPCNINEISSIDFACIKHDAWMANGSSGGLLMDLSFRLIGINFAINNHPLTGEHIYSWSVPVTRVKEFLIANQLWGA